MRRWLDLAGVAALGLSLAACGASPGAKASAASVAGTPTTTRAMSMPMGASGMSMPTAGPVDKLAAAAVLSASDVSGYAATPAEHDPTDDSVERDLQHCLAVPGLQFTDRDYGTVFTKGDTRIDAGSALVGSPAVARALAAAAAKQAGCFQNQFDDEVEKADVDVIQMSVTPAAVDVRGADIAFAFHIVATVAGVGGYEPLEAYSVDAFSGRTEAIVTRIVTRAKAPALSDVAQLAGVAVARVRAAEAAK